MAIHFRLERSDKDFHARADDGERFFVGRLTRFADPKSGVDFEGLFNVPNKKLPKLLFKADDFRAAHGFWADFIEPTARCEGGNFLTLNTYDRARFTWGFGQFGAHVADGDFVRFFRDLLGRPEAVDYFPNLELRDGRIVKIEGDKTISLESAQGTGPLLDLLNPSTHAVEDAEVIAAAKLVHWTTAHAGARDLQVLHMINTFKRLMRESDKRLGLDGRTADLCCVVCDIRHQGRAKFDRMQEALNASAPLKALLEIGKISFGGRIKTLGAEIAARAHLFASKHWSRSTGDFV